MLLKRWIIFSVLWVPGADAALSAAQPVNNVAIELSRLDELKRAEITELQVAVEDSEAEVWHRRIALRRIANLATLDSVRILERLYHSATGGVNAWSKRDIVELLAETGRAEAATQLAVASADPDPGAEHRWVAAQGLANIRGVEAIPRLRAMLNDRHPTVRREARRQLARLSDAETVGLLIDELLESQDHAVRLQALTDLTLAESIELKGALHRVFTSSPADGGPDALELKLLAGDSALMAGSKETVAGMIELVPLTKKHLRGLPIVRTPAESLAMCTHENFGTNVEAWQRWWREQRNSFQLFRTPRNPRDTLEIERAVLYWTLDKQSGPIVPEAPIYLDRHGHDRDLASDVVRLYTPVEIELLGKTGHSLTVFSTNGSLAIARLRTLGAVERVTDITLRRHAKEWFVEARKEIKVQ